MEETKQEAVASKVRARSRGGGEADDQKGGLRHQEMDVSVLGAAGGLRCTEMEAIHFTERGRRLQGMEVMHSQHSKLWCCLFCGELLVHPAHFPSMQWCLTCKILFKIK
jgi:hypothetical protein